MGVALGVMTLAVGVPAAAQDDQSGEEALDALRVLVPQGDPGEYDITETLCHEGLALTDASDDRYGRVIALSVLCQTAYERGDLAAARAWGEQSLELEQQIGSRWSVAFSLTNLGKVLASGNPGHIRTHQEVINAYLGA